jgi:SAM-dependent methyltransferase
MLASLLLRFPAVYSLFGVILGGNGRHRFAANHVRPFPGQRILDIGCGPADILAALPGNIEYVGFDESEPYIEAARRRFNGLGQFRCARVTPDLVGEFSGFDVVLALGILHHLDDRDCVTLLSIARSALAAEGRLVTLDGCYTEDQSALARFLLRSDRGRRVRTQEGYAQLARTVFPKIEYRIYDDLVRLPYNHLVMECRV